MNHGGHNGQQDAASNYPFAYAFSLPTQGNHEHDPSHQALMNDEQQSYMDGFWDQPDQITTDNTNEVVPYSFLGAGLNDKGGENAVNAFGFHMPNGMDFSVGMGSHSNHMPASAASAPRNFNHMAPPSLSHYDASKGFEDFTYENDQPSTTTGKQRITHDDQAASALMSMSSHSQDQPQPASAGGSSWGNINFNNSAAYADDQLHMAGDPSSGSAVNTPLTPTFTENFQRLGRSTSHSQFPQHKMMPQATQPTQPNGYGQTRHQSLSMGTNGPHMIHSPMGTWHMPHATTGQDQNPTQRRPQMYQYGSDQNFSQQGYQAATYSTPEAKYSNLLNLPLAPAARAPQATIAPAQQAGNMRGHDQQHRNSLPNNLQQLSSAALAHQNTNLQAPSSTYSRPPKQMYSTQAMKDLDLAQQSGRKRRRSQPDEDAAMQYGFAQNDTQNRASATGRAPVALKQENTSEQFQAGYTSPPGSSNKRQKASSAHLGTISNSASASPTIPAATTSKAASSSKKRRSETKQPRHNLTDTQKRNNHIASEQKRRDAMKTNYEELNLYVPTLRQGTQGLSRSEILQHSGDWLESLRNGNEAIMHAYGITFDDITELHDQNDADD